MNPIIIGVGSQETSPAALVWSLDLARVTKAEAVVVRIFEPPYAEIPPDWYDELADRDRMKVEMMLADVGVAEGSVPIVSRTGYPAQVLAETADQRDAGLVVVHAQGFSQPGGLGAWGFAHHLLHQSHPPVAVIPEAYEPLVGGTIVVGVDGTGANARALQFAEQLAPIAGGRIHAVFAYDPIDDTFGLPEGWHRHSDEVRREVAQVQAAEVDLTLAPGHPTQVLADAARRDRAAAIVVGTRGRGGFDELRVGRVPMQLIHHAGCPLVIVPHGPRASRESPTLASEAYR